MYSMSNQAAHFRPNFKLLDTTFYTQQFTAIQKVVFTRTFVNAYEHSPMFANLENVSQRSPTLENVHQPWKMAANVHRRSKIVANDF